MLDFDNQCIFRGKVVDREADFRKIYLYSNLYENSQNYWKHACS